MSLPSQRKRPPLHLMCLAEAGFTPDQGVVLRRPHTQRQEVLLVFTLTQEVTVPFPHLLGSDLSLSWLATFKRIGTKEAKAKVVNPRMCVCGVKTKVLLGVGGIKTLAQKSQR